MEAKARLPIFNFSTLFVFIISGLLQQVSAQDTIKTKTEQLNADIQLRVRGEYRHGLFTPITTSQTAAGFIAQRSRLGLSYKKGNNISAAVQLQATNVWGNEPQVQQTGNNITLYQAWVQFSLLNNVQVKLGRQVLSYDDERILGALDWNNAGRKHDAALLKYRQGKFKADLALAYNQNAERVTNDFFNDSLSQPYKSLEMLWMQYLATNSLSFSALILNIDKQGRADAQLSHLQTFGLNGQFKNKMLMLHASAYYQLGQSNFSNQAYQNTNAWMASLYGTYQANHLFSISLGSDFLSGRDLGSTTNDNTVFNTLYSTGHKFYGNMDYFYVSSPHHNLGLWDSYCSASYQATPTFNGQLAYHHFQSPSKVLDYAGQTVAKALGDEFDLIFLYQVKDGIKISGGYSFLLPSTSMKYAKDIPASQSIQSVQNWAWLTVNFSPDIIIFKRAY